MKWNSKEVWESEYKSGRWDYLNQLEQLARYSVIAGYFQFFKRGGSILDVGCGEGILQERLGPSTYSRYMGIDLSSEAINRASRREDEKTSFICKDAGNFIPFEQFDAVVFNEVLYYFDDPLRVLEAYKWCLKEDGIFIVSSSSDERSTAIRRRLKATYHAVDEVTATNGPKSWTCTLFFPFSTKDSQPGSVDRSSQPNLTEMGRRF